MKTLKSIFDHHFAHVKFDQHFKENVELFIRRFQTKNDEHIGFMGTNLIGVYALRWNYTDTDTWWDDIFDVPDSLVEEDLHRHPEIKTNRIVSSDVLNHAMIYTLHRIHHSTFLKEEDKPGLKMRVMLALNLKFISSLFANYFRYPADRGIAEKAYNSLSKRFDLRVYGTWQKMLVARSEDFVAPTGRYYKSYVNYTDDIEIIKMINDAQGRIRDTVKEVTRVYYQCLYADAKVLSSSSQVNVDGTIMLKDIQRKATAYNRYIKNILTTKDSYIKEPLTQLIFRAVPSLQPEMYDKLQQSLLDNFQGTKYSKDINAMVDELIAFSFNFLVDNEIKDNDLSTIVYRLKHVYMSGRVLDENLDKARKHFEKLVESADKKLKGTPLVPERCGVFLYLMIRTLTMNYFK